MEREVDVLKASAFKAIDAVGVFLTDFSDIDRDEVSWSMRVSMGFSVLASVDGVVIDLLLVSLYELSSLFDVLCLLSVISDVVLEGPHHQLFETRFFVVNYFHSSKLVLFHFSGDFRVEHLSRGQGDAQESKHGK